VRVSAATAAILVVLLLFACGRTSSDDPATAEPAPIRRDLAEIRTGGKLIAITGYSATSYFIYRGQPMGYEYELLQRLASDLQLDLEMVVARDFNQIFSMLNRGEGDIIAFGLTVTKARSQQVSFTETINTTRQVLVQRLPENWRSMKQHEIERELVRNPVDLIQREVHVWRNSSYYTRLLNLSEEIGGNIRIVEEPGSISQEELIRRVAEGAIDFTVVDENLALIHKSYYPDIDVDTPVSFPQRLAWAVRRNAPELRKAVNKWLHSMKADPDYYVIYNKYYKNERAFVRRMASDFFSMTSGERISPYDEQIREKAGLLGWDWRLLASLIYQESGFDPVARSWAGALGLMQLIPSTGRMFGAEDLFDPEENMTAGALFLKWLDEYWAHIANGDERLKFILASYNVGHEHVEDARRLAEKYGRNPDIWADNVEYFLLQKSKRKFFNDPVVRFGYCRGEETVNYVSSILDRYREYRQFIAAAEEEG
jgi:membrane-bound lytic murein transglycosylase F